MIIIITTLLLLHFLVLSSSSSPSPSSSRPPPPAIDCSQGIVLRGHAGGGKGLGQVTELVLIPLLRRNNETRDRRGYTARHYSGRRLMTTEAAVHVVSLHRRVMCHCAALAP
jgi:hypothetical protein